MAYNKCECIDGQTVITASMMNDLQDAVVGAEKNIKQLQENPGSGPGTAGATFTPAVSEDGVLSWTNNGGLQNPEPVDLSGPKGDPGAPGAPGDPGYAPQKGVDYWTPSDIAEIKSYVDEAILGGEW